MNPAPTQVDVLVYGAGAIGQYLGARLAASGVSVHFVARSGVVTALRSHGLTVSEFDGREESIAASHIGASEDLASAPTPRLVLLTVKSGATRDAAVALAAALPAGTPVISFQNGVENAEVLARAAPQLDAIAGMVPYNVVQSAPGHVQRTTTGRLAAQRRPATEAWADAFARAGLALDLSDDFRAVQWGKLLLNLNNPINAIAGVPLRAQLLDRDYRFVLAALQDETLDLLQIARIAPARVTPVPSTWIPRLLRLPTPLFRLAAKRMLSIHPAARSSMYDDRVAGRVTEIDALCGAVLRLAQGLGRDAPLNHRLAEFITTLAPGEFWSGAMLRQRMRLSAPYLAINNNTDRPCNP